MYKEKSKNTLCSNCSVLHHICKKNPELINKQLGEKNFFFLNVLVHSC